MKIFIVMLLATILSAQATEERAATMKEKVAFCHALKKYNLSDDGGNGLYGFSETLCRLSNLTAWYPNKEIIDIDGRVPFQVRGISMNLLCMAEMTKGKIVEDSMDCTF